MLKEGERYHAQRRDVKVMAREARGGMETVARVGVQGKGGHVSSERLTPEKG